MSAVKTIEEIAEETPIRKSLPEANADKIMHDAILLARTKYSPKPDEDEFNKLSLLENAEIEIKSKELAAVKDIRRGYNEGTAFFDALTSGASYSMLIHHHVDLAEKLQPREKIGYNQRRRRMGLYFMACMHNFNEPFRLKINYTGYHEEAKPFTEIGLELWDSIKQGDNIKPNWLAIAAELYFRHSRLVRQKGYGRINLALALLETANSRLDEFPEDADAVEVAARNMYLWSHDQKDHKLLQSYARNLKALIEQVHRYPSRKHESWLPLPV